jgi:chemotaxis signal transduction protein
MLAVDGKVLRQVVTVSQLTPVPRSSPSLLGLFADRGTILPLLDLHPMLALQTRAHRATDLALLVEHEGATFALSIDEMVGFFPYEGYKEHSPTLQGFSSAIIDGGGQEVALLDVAQIANSFTASVAAN